MKRNLLFLVSLLWLSSFTWAQQTPKWVEKAKRAVISVVTYDDQERIIGTSNGFLVSDDGVAVADYSLFKGAKRAVAITTDSKQLEVTHILGASSLYDIIRFQINTEGKRLPFLTPGTSPSEAEKPVWALPYSTRHSIACEAGRVKSTSAIADGHTYYTLSMPPKSNMEGCPVMNESGQVIGILQQAAESGPTDLSYALGLSFAQALQINALSLNDPALSSIGIRKAMPQDEDQALVALLVASTQADASSYSRMLDEFVARFPQNPEGYLRRASFRIGQANDSTDTYQTATDDLTQALKVAAQKDEVLFQQARILYNYRLNRPEGRNQAWTFDAALKRIQEAKALNPLPAYTRFEGDIHFARQDYAAALACYESVNAGPAASSSSFFSAAKTKEMLQAKPEEVVSLLDSCLARCSQPFAPGEAAYLLERAAALMNASQARRALADYDHYFQIVNGQVNDRFYLHRYQAALQSKQYQRALDDIAKAIELAPDELLYRVEQGATNLRVGRYNEAIADFDRIIRQEPDYGEAYRLRGICYTQLKQVSQATADLTKALELGDPYAKQLLEKLPSR